MSGFIPPPGGSVNFKVAFCLIASGGVFVPAGALNVNGVLGFAVGNYFVDYTAAGFTQIPQVFFQLMSDAGTAFRYQYLVSADAVQGEVQIYDDTGTPTDNRVCFFAIGV